MYLAGIDIGGTKTAIGVFCKDGSPVAEKTVATDRQGGGESILRSAAAGLDTLLKEAGLSRDAVSFCGIGVPGTVSADRRVAEYVPNLNLSGCPAAELFEGFTGIPAAVVQDSRAGALGEYLFGAGRNKKCVICITLGTGIGTGIVMDGKIYDGALGGAGELGHVPVTESGRACGCGRTGCLEKYAGGLGLEQSAREILGENATTHDLFDAIPSNPKAADCVRQAVEQLGRVIVSAVNLLSPDCLLFSGGLSARRAEFLDPLIDYIKGHAYSLTVERGIEIRTAELGARAPMVGAAFLPHSGKPVRRESPYRVSASIMCGDWLNMQRTLDQMEQNGIALLHCDIMDGHFVDNLMFPPDMLRAIGKYSPIPMDFHLMTDKPEQVLGRLSVRPGDIVSVHYESTDRPEELLREIRSRGALASLAISPDTPLESVKPLLQDLDMVLCMTVYPGFAGQKMVPFALDRIKALRALLDQAGYPQIRIEVDGNCSFENIPKMKAAGADTFVAGSSSVFDAKLGVETACERLRQILAPDEDPAGR